MSISSAFKRHAMVRSLAGVCVCTFALTACVQSQGESLSALVPAEALNEQTAAASQTVDTSRELSEAAAAAEKAVAPSAKPAEKAAATAFAEAKPERTRETVATTKESGAGATDKGSLASWLKKNRSSSTARNREEAEARLARLKEQSLARSKAKRVSASSTARAPAQRRTAKRPRVGVADDAGLPGVRTSSLFGIESATSSLFSRERRGSTRKKSGNRPPVVTASVAARTRGPGRALLRQHAKVHVGCLKPALVRMIRKAERHFGRRAVVTSGYRSPRHNRRVRGARRSLHMSCAAADIQIKGVPKWKLASYLRSVPGRGGVGTYCHTRSVHVDIGSKRDWNWRCRRSKKRRRS